MYGAEQREVDAVRAALADEGNVSGISRFLVAAVAYAEPAVIDPHAVGANEQKPCGPGHLGDLLLGGDAFGSLGLGKPGCEQRHRTHLLLDAVGDDPRRDLPRYRSDDVVDLVRHLEEAFVVGDTQLLDAGDLVRVDL